jgi:preprotein translocase subunit SecA
MLIGTRSVAVSEHLSDLFRGAGLEHQVLNARRDKEEALIVARAGEEGRVTIATNMAGRGTDIKLGTGVPERGGLHVILTERHEAGRIDRQLAGRCGRRGDPGTYEAFLSLEDQLLSEAGSGILAWIARLWMRLALPGGTVLCRLAFGQAQRRVERQHARIRKNLLVQDERLREWMSFSGRLE